MKLLDVAACVCQLKDRYDLLLIQTNLHQLSTQHRQRNPSSGSARKVNKFERPQSELRYRCSRFTGLYFDLKIAQCHFLNLAAFLSTESDLMSRLLRKMRIIKNAAPKCGKEASEIQIRVKCTEASCLGTVGWVRNHARIQTIFSSLDERIIGSRWKSRQIVNSYFSWPAHARSVAG